MMSETNILKENGFSKFFSQVIFTGDKRHLRILNGIISIGLICFAFFSAISISLTLISLLLWITPAFILKLILEKGKSIKRTPLDFGLGLYILIVLITSITSYRIEGWIYIKNSLSWFYTTGIAFIAYYIVYYNLKDKLRDILLISFTTGVFINCIYAIYQFIQFSGNYDFEIIFNRPAGFLFWVTYSSLLVFAVLISLYFTFKKGILIYRIFGFINFVVLSAGVIFSISRSAIVSYFFANISHIVLRKKYIYLMIVILFLVSIFVVPDIVLERVKETFLTEDGTLTLNFNERFDERGEIYKTGIEMIRRYPILGVGPENIATEYLKFRPLNSRYTFASLHNNFLHITAESGIIGFLSFGFLLFLILKTLVKNIKSFKNTEQKNLNILGLSVFIAFFITGLVLYNFGDFEVLNAFMCISAIVFFKGED